MPSTELPAQHLVLELRYDPALAFYSVMDKIGLELAETYPDWERSPLTLEIRNKKLHRRCFLSSQRCFYEALDFAAQGTEIERATKLFEKVHRELKFTKVRRIGFRQWLTATSDEPFAQMVKVMVRRIHPQDDKLHNMLRGCIEDIGYIADVLSEHGWKYHLRLGPMERKQWFELIPHEVGMFDSAVDFKKYQDAFPERFFFIDLDCYKDETTYSDLVLLLSSMRQVSSEILGDLIHYLKA
jgi:hypothetical protein